MTTLLRRTTVFALLCLPFCLPASAQTSALLTGFRGAPFTSTVDELRAASAAMPASHDYGVVVLLEEETYRFAPDSTVAFQHHLIYRVDAQDAIEGWSEISARWDPWFEQPAQLHARVLQADGHFVELEQKTITDAPVKADDSETFSSQHLRRAPLPGVAIGAIIEEVDEIDEKIPYFAAGGLYRSYFRRGVPVAEARVFVDIPRSLPFKEVTHNLAGLARDSNSDQDRQHLTYVLKNIAPSVQSDIDLSSNEPDGPLLEFATGASWKSVSDGYLALAEPETIPAETQPILPKTLPSGRMEKIQAIVAALHHEVRYTGVEFGAARLTPQRPSAVIERHYGDCKDKATLLVAMLRAEGIPANIALLSTGPGRDVDPALPGMSQFNHAIVYVPAAGKDPAVWIDATAEFYAPGVLPFDDKGRMALIAAPGTTGLTKIPDASPQDSTLIETRSFTLAPFGPSHVVETSETHGIIDANYRSSYGSTDETRISEDLTNYAHNAYYAKGAVKVTHGDAHDLTQPFHLSLAVDGARRGFTALDEAVVAVFTNMVLNSLPRWFAKAPPVIGPETTDEEKRRLELAKRARLGSYVFSPFTDERRIRIQAPDGFALRSLPPNKTTQMGPATFTETYTSTEPGVLTATLRLDTGSGVLTPDEALAMRTAVLELNKREYVGIYFDQVAAKAFADGKIRKALDTDRALIAAHPSEALNHVRLSRLLLNAGIGDEAHLEALRGTQLDPKSAVAFNTLGWSLEHDSLGVRFGKGYDRAGSIAAYKQAIALDPDDNDPRFDLAILYEFDARGIRYSPNADMPLAIAAYKELVERTKDKNDGSVTQYQNNLLYALLYAKQFAELDKLLASLPYNNAHASLAIASAAAQRGAAAGIAESEKGNVAAGDRNKNLLAAGHNLASMRLYPVASEVLKAGIAGGGDDAPTTARQIEMYKALKPVDLSPLPPTNPAAPVQAITFATMAGTLTHDLAVASISRHAYASDAALERDVAKGLQTTGFLRQVAEKSELSETVLLDLIAGSMTFTSTGDDATGYAITQTSLGEEPTHFYVVKEDGSYRMVSDASNDTSGNSAVGNEALYALEHGNPKLAKAILDWKRDLTHKQGGDDAFAGPLLPRFWTVGSSKPDADSPAAMRLAAIALLAGSMDAKPYLPEVAAAREKASGQRQTDLDLLLAVAAAGAEQAKLALPAALRLLDQEPDSEVALSLAGQCYALENDAAAWLKLLAPRIAKKPKDHDLLIQQEQAYYLAGDYAAARKSAQGAIDSGKATSSDYNSYAWLGLFDDHIGDDALKAAQQSNMMSKNNSFADLHTLACIYAAEGRTTEARQVLSQAMYAGSESEPNAAVWYALGLIYEQYGANGAALAAYRKVSAHEFDDHTYIDPASTYLLAQRRIKALAGATK